MIQRNVVHIALILAASDAPVFRYYWRKKIQTFVLIPHIAPMVILRGWQENPYGWCYRLVYTFHGTILKFSETIFKSSPSWGHLACLQLWCCICSFRISLFLWSTLHTHRNMLYVQSQHLCSKNQLWQLPWWFLWERQTAPARGTDISFYTGH